MRPTADSSLCSINLYTSMSVQTVITVTIAKVHLYIPTAIRNLIYSDCKAKACYNLYIFKRAIIEAFQ